MITRYCYKQRRIYEKLQLLQAKLGHLAVATAHANVTGKEGAMIKRYCYKQRSVYEKLQPVQVRIGH